jgi:methyl halide transferase
MNLPPLDSNYWEGRYQNGATGWDVGHITPPLKAYFDQLTRRDLRILVPGAGHAHEAEYLWRQGFVHTHVLDLAPGPLETLRLRCPGFPPGQFILGDFFAHTGHYDLVVEQTFFCALAPARRPAYARHMHTLLKPGGKLVGLLFDAPLNADQPPFGGSRDEYVGYFAPYFSFRHFEPCHNSLKPRAGRELFVLLERAGTLLV